VKRVPVMADVGPESFHVGFINSFNVHSWSSLPCVWSTVGVGTLKDGFVLGNSIVISSFPSLPFRPVFFFYCLSVSLAMGLDPVVLSGRMSAQGRGPWGSLGASGRS